VATASAVRISSVEEAKQTFLNVYLLNGLP
jgi:hypothetical protein